MSILNRLTLIAIAVVTLMTTACSGGEQDYRPADTTTAPAVIQNILTRTSVRSFNSQPVAADTIDILLRAAMAAPSAKNAQPWKFVVVADKDLKKQIGEQLPNVGTGKMENATVAIIVCGDSTKFIPEMNDYWVQDCSAASQNILLAANACRLGAVWCGIYPDPERVATLRSIVGLPENLIPLNVIPVGHPDSFRNPIDKFNPENIIRF